MPPRGSAGGATAPVRPGEGFALLAAALAAPRRASPNASPLAILAVSGGPDSLALLAFAGENRDRLAAEGVCFRVVTVDHGLRPEAAAEAGAVAALSRRFGLSHETLRWAGWDGRGNLQAAAREARYGLLEDAARRAGAGAVLTAHHQDDQVETHLLAAERGGGGGGYAGMRPCRDLAPGVFLLRPFLDFPKARLVASVEDRGLVAADDPTNRSPHSRRAALRQAIDAGALDRVAVLERIRLAAAARDRAEAALVSALWSSFEDAWLAADNEGRLFRGHDAFRALERTLACDLLSRFVTAVGGAAYPPSRASVERLEWALRRAHAGFAATLAGCEVRVTRRRVCVFSREYGRTGPDAVDLAGRDRVVFDRRFDCIVPGRLRRGEAGRVVPFGRIGRSGGTQRTLPVLLDADGRPVAAHEAVAAKLDLAPGGMAFQARVRWRAFADLRDADGRILEPRLRFEPPDASGLR